MAVLVCVLLEPHKRSWPQMVSRGGHPMVKAILIGTTALAIAGSTLVYAQQRPGGRDGDLRGGPNVEDMRAFGEARLAALRAGLLLNAEQATNWPAFEQAARDVQTLRRDRITAFMAARRDPQ